MNSIAARVPHPDHPRRDEADRYALYALAPGKDHARRVCETSREGIGLALLTMLGLDPEGNPDEGTPAEIDRGDAVGVFDRLNRSWLINPYLERKT